MLLGAKADESNRITVPDRWTTRSQLLRILSWVCLTIIVGYLTKTLCWCALGCFDVFELLRMILHQYLAASYRTKARGNLQDRYATRPTQRLKDGADLRLTAFLLLLRKKSDNTSDFLLKQNKLKIAISPEMVSPLKRKSISLHNRCMQKCEYVWVGPWCIEASSAAQWPPSLERGCIHFIHK